MTSDVLHIVECKFMITFFIALTALLAGLITAAFGVGAGVFLTPLLSLFIAPKMVVALLAPMMLFSDITSLVMHWRKWNIKYILILTPGILMGVLAGSYFLAWASPTLTKISIGIIAITFSTYQIIRLKKPDLLTRIQPGDGAGAIISFIAGITSAIAHSGGIVVTIYLVTKNLSKTTFVATLVSILFFCDLLKLITFWKLDIINTSLLVSGLELIPALLLGSWLGARLLKKLTYTQFILYVNILIFISGLMLMVKH